MYDVRERDVQEQLLLTEQRHVLVPDLPGWIETAASGLIESAEPVGEWSGRCSSCTTVR